MTENSYISRFLADKLDAGEMLHTFVKAEGATLAAVESDSILPQPETSGWSGTDPVSMRQQKILYRKDDPVSRKIAEKILADLSHAGIPGALIASSPQEYQRALLQKNYDCAIGWVPETVKNDRSETLRLVSMWFNDQTDESLRIAGRSEIPLFTVNRYLLVRTGIGLFRGHVDGIYRE